MSGGQVVVLISSILVCLASALVAGGCGLLLWVHSRLRPHSEIRAHLSELSAMVSSLEAQVNKLRTQKAGARSAARRAEATQEQLPPELEGLTEDDLALFR